MTQRRFFARPHRTLLMLLLALAVGAFAFSPAIDATTCAWAQDGGDDLLEGIDLGLDDGGDAGGDAAEPAADAADEGAAEAAPAATDSKEGGETKKEQSYLAWVLKAVGWFFGPVFLILSFIMVAFLVMNILALRRENIMPSGLTEQFNEHLEQKQFQEAYEVAKADGSFLGIVLAAGLAKLSSGYEEAAADMEAVGEDETMKLEHRLSYLALIGNVSPMIGLFGTVYGMMQAFSIIAVSGSTPDPSELAMKISTAMVTTFIGLAIAIPAVVVFNILRNRLARLVLEVGLATEGIMGRFKK